MIALISDHGWDSIVTIIGICGFASVFVAINWPDRRD